MGGSLSRFAVPAAACEQAAAREASPRLAQMELVDSAIASRALVGLGSSRLSGIGPHEAGR